MEIGALLCCICLCSWLCICVIGPKVMAVGRQITGRRVLLLALSLCFGVFFSCLPCPSVAMAEEYLEIDATELPSNYRQVMMSRHDGGEYVAIQGDSAVLLSASDDAGGGDDGGSVIESVAQEVFNTIIGNAISNGQANKALLDDLSWRYYNADATKRDRMPIEPVGNAPSLGDFSNWAEWDNYLRLHYVFNYPYRLVGFDDGKSWESISPNADIEYEKWYNFYQDIEDSGGGSGGETDGELPEGMVGGYVLNLNNYTSDIRVYDGPTSTTYQDVPSTTYQQCILIFDDESVRQAVVGKLQYPLWLLSQDGDINATETEGLTFITQYPDRFRINAYEKPASLSPVTLVVATLKRSTYKYFTAEGVLFCLVQVSNEPGYADRTFTWEGNGKSWNFTAPTYAATELVPYGGGGGNEPTEPVYPVYPGPDTPVQPAPPDAPSYTIDSPTYNNYTSNETTATTADLTPVLNAIRILNDNMKTGFGNMETAIDTCCGNMRRMLEAWLTNITEWQSIISGQIDEWNRNLLEELRIANEWLEGIFYKLQGGGGSTPDATVDDSGYWDWLDDLAEKVLGNLPEAATELVDAFTGLRGLFPFSIPWDLGAMLLLFVSSPVTPVFTLPVPYAANGVASVTVDLHGWDGVMSAVRSIELVAFAAGLAAKTRALLKNTEVSE